MQLDHAVIRVDDLKIAVAHSDSLGCLVVMGGEHAEGLTANAFLYFRDRPFIELIRFIKPARVRILIRRGLGYLLMANGLDHLRYRFGQAAGFPPSLIDAALLAKRLEDLSAHMTWGGIEHIAPQQFGRDTPHGVHLTWRVFVPFGFVHSFRSR
jgi:hypothetical protein